ncbi:MAG: L-rhamnose mutarotase [Bacteroidales bacterium]|nr:L-rhamnose mutarotase [Bacteroidales bacterium]
MSNESHISLGSIIGLRKEFEEQYILLHKHTFPGVLNRISLSNITDYSIFLHNGILFSHMVYNGTDYDADMKALGTDKTTREWWKLTDTMQQPLDSRKDNEWWSGINLWFSYQSPIPATSTVIRHAYTLPVSSGLEATVPNDHFGDIDFWGTTYGLKNLRIFKGVKDVYIYFETLKDSEHTFLLEIITRVLKTDKAPIEMTEVFHTEAHNSVQAQPNKKVFVTGCFDMLHSGHVAFLQEAAGYGDLYVSIGVDENVYNLKGRYPVNTQNERKYMIDALACVKSCIVNSGWGIIDFEKELEIVKPDVFVVNEDGHTPSKQVLCEEMGIEYHILKRIPHADLPVRSTTMLRTECTIPFRIDLAGGWLDQPYVSTHFPGSVITISIEPTIEFNDRSGMSSSTRRKAIELWRNEIPHGDAEHLAKMLFSFENPPGTQHVSGSQDSLGIVLPGLNKLDYKGNYWPEKINTLHEEDVLSWLEQNLYLVTLGPRIGSYSPLENTNITPAGAKALSDSTEDCWESILKKDIRAFGNAFRNSFEAQIAMFPNMVDNDILQTIEQFKDKAKGWKLSGAGGGGYIILVSDSPIEGAMQIKIRRKYNL